MHESAELSEPGQELEHRRNAILTAFHSLICFLALCYQTSLRPILVSSESDRAGGTAGRRLAGRLHHDSLLTCSADEETGCRLRTLLFDT